MPLVYFDASAFVKLLTTETGSSLASALWDGCDAALSSRLAYPEVRAALAAAARNHDLTESELAEAERDWEDFVTFFDCLHDMGDPGGASSHVRKSLKQDGTWMIVEPNAGDRLEDNLNPVGRVFYGASTLVCTPASRDQEVGLALGAQAGEARLRDVVTQGGFTRFRRAAETPFNIVLEARP